MQTKASQSVSQWKIRTKSTQKNRKKELKMDNCIFCKIAGGEIPAATLYEDENFRVILDLGPASKGHALILQRLMPQIFMRFQTNWQQKQ